MSHLDEGVLHAVLDGEVSSVELGPIQRHLAECRDCQARFEEARQFRDEALGLVERLDPVPIAIAVAAAPASRLGAARRPARRWPVPLAWAATLIGAIGLGYAIGGVRAPPAAAPLAMNEITTAAPAPATSESEVAKPKEPIRASDDERRARPRAAEPVAQRQTTPANANRQPTVADSITVTEPKQAVTETATSPALAKVAAPPPQALASAELKDALSARAAASAVGARPGVSADLDRGGAQGRTARRELLRNDGPAPPNPADQRRRTISAVAAITALGGSIRLVDGLTPLRFEQQGEVIRVVYRTAIGIVVLEQWRAGGLLAHELIAPADAPADSVRAWEGRIR